MPLARHFCRVAMVLATIAMLALPAFGQAACCCASRLNQGERTAKATGCCHTSTTGLAPCECSQAPDAESRDHRTPTGRGETLAASLSAPAFTAVETADSLPPISVAVPRPCEDLLALHCVWRK